MSKVTFDPEAPTGIYFILPGVAEGEFLFGESDPYKLGQLFLNHGASVVVMKIGAEGAYYFTKKESALILGFPVKQVVDPVGAGDGFAAGFLAGVLGWFGT